MLALTLHGDEDIRHERVEDPTVEEPDDAVVGVSACAICGSDLHPYLGRESGYDPGTVPGHEFVGEVLAVGPGVGGLRPGDRVHAPFTTSCGRCPSCRRGLTARCERGELFGWRQGGKGLHGGQAERVRVPLADSTLVRIPEGIDDTAALLLGDVLSTGFHGARLAGSGPGSRILVVGCGPVGLMAIAGARELGAERVVAVDPVPERRELARRFGAEAHDLLEGAALLDLFNGGADGAVEAVGSRASTRTAFDALRPGGVLASVGVHTRPDFGFTPVEAYDRNLTLRFGRCSARPLMEELVPMVRTGRYPLEDVVTHRLPLADGPDAYRMVASRSAGCAKVVLTV